MNLEQYRLISQRDYEAVAGPDWPSYADFQQHKSVAPFIYKEIDQMLTGPAQFDNPAFCVLPFYARELPEDKPCCYIEKPYNLEQVKQEMLAGQRPKECQQCWRLEDTGIKSNRQLANETTDFYFDQDLTQIFEECQQGQNQPLHYKVTSSNTCNSTCITCDSFSSSLWGQMERRNGVSPHPTWSLNQETFTKEIDFAQAKSIGFLGGEPLLSATNFQILEQLIAHNNCDCFIHFQTNGGVELSKRQRDILANFSNINMSFSIDGVGPVFEYLRYPLKWDLLLENIEACRSSGMIVSACYTLSNLNLLYHNDTCAWFKENNLPYLINVVEHPRHFRPGALPKAVKERILEQSELSNMLAAHTEQDDKDFEQFKLEILKQDAWKGIKMQDYLPKLCELLG